MKFIKIARLLCMVILAVACQSVQSATRLPRVAPSAVGIDPHQVTLLYDSLLQSKLTEPHHLIVTVGGKVVCEMHPKPYKAEYKHTLYSVSKTFTATAVGLLVDDGLLSVDDELAKFFPEYATYIKGVRIQDLLTMRAGFKVETDIRAAKEDWVKNYLSRPLVNKPGEKFAYDSMATYMLSAVIQKITGKTTLELLNERVFHPMGIFDAEWEHCPKGIVVGGWGLYLSAESQAIFGQLLLNRGEWQGKQLVSRKWMNEMMTTHVIDRYSDYGYQMWLSDYPGAWRADGAYGQYIITVPQKDMVIVLNECARSNGITERNYFWNTIVKHCMGWEIDTTPDAIKAWTDYEATASLPVLDGERDNNLSKKIFGKKFVLEENRLEWKSIKLNRRDNNISLEYVDNDNNKSTIEMGYKEWITSQLAGTPHYSIIVESRFSTLSRPFFTGSCYAWQDEMLTTKIHYTNWITSLLLKFRLDDDGRLAIDVQESFSNKPFTIKSK